MRVRITYSVDVDDRERMAIAAERDGLEPEYTEDGRRLVRGQRLATHAEVRWFYETYGLACEGTVNDWLRLLDESAETLARSLQSPVRCATCGALTHTEHPEVTT